MFNIDIWYQAELYGSLGSNLVLTKSGDLATVMVVIISETGAMLMHTLRLYMTTIDLQLILPDIRTSEDESHKNI